MPQTSPSPSSPGTCAPGSSQAAAPQDGRSQTDCVDSQEILRGQKTMAINHNGLTYRLQATRLGKLILTK